MNFFKRNTGKGPDVSNRRREKGQGVAGRFATETKKTNDGIVLPAAPAPERHEDLLTRTWDEEVLWQGDGGAEYSDARMALMVNHAAELHDRLLRENTPESDKGNAVLRDALDSLGAGMHNQGDDTAASAVEIAKARAMLHDRFRDASLADSAPAHREIDRDLGIMQQYLIDTRQADMDPSETLPTAEETYNKRWEEARAHLAAYDGTGLTPDQGRRAVASSVVAEDLAYLRQEAQRTGSKIHGMAAAAAAELPHKLVAAGNAEEALAAIHQTRFDLGEAAYKVGASGEAGRDSFGELHDTLNSMETLVAMEMRKPSPAGAR